MGSSMVRSTGNLKGGASKFEVSRKVCLIGL